ncbi:hypothetical protein RQP46_003762 [Phenoliferia psychrophenolica]
MNATIHSLAPELLDHILDLVRGPSVTSRFADAVPKNSDLLSAALVCRLWAETAQRRVLWRDARIILDQTKPPLALPEFKYPLNHLWIAVRAWLEDAPPVKSLCMTTERVDAGPNWGFLQSPSLSGLTRLDLEYCEMVEEPINTLEPFSLHLTHLGLAIYSIIPSAHLVRALFSASRTTLISLRLSISIQWEKEWTIETLLTEELAMVAPNLETLVIDFSCAHDNDQDYLNLRAFERLRVLNLDLRYKEYSESYNHLFPITPYLDQLSALHLPLKHLGVGITSPSHISDVADALSHSALDHLEILELTNLDESELASPPASPTTAATFGIGPDLTSILIQPERRKRWKNVEDTREEYHTTNTVEVYIFGIPACGMINVPGETTFTDLWNHVRRCLSLSPTITCDEGLGFIILQDSNKIIPKDRYEHYGPMLFSPSNDLRIDAPRKIEISLDIISRIIRTPDNLELSPRELQEIRVMFLYFEIAFSEEEDRGEERKDFVDMASEQRIGCLLRHSVPRLFLSPPFDFPLIPTEDEEAVDEVGVITRGVAKLGTAGAGPAEGQAA